MVLSGNVDLTGPATNGHRVPGDNAAAKQQFTELVLNLFGLDVDIWFYAVPAGSQPDKEVEPPSMVDGAAGTLLPEL